MNATEETEIHALAIQLEQLTQGTGWEAMRYWSIGLTMKRLAEYCAVCDCQKKQRGAEKKNL